MSFDPLRLVEVLKDEFIQLLTLGVCFVVLIIYYLGGFVVLGPYIIVIWLLWIASVVALGLRLLNWWARYR